MMIRVHSDMGVLDEKILDIDTKPGFVNVRNAVASSNF